MLTIGAVARQVGVPPSTLRYYEAQGILRPSARLPNGYRVYGEDAVSLLRFVRRAQAFGFTLAEIKQLIELAQQGQLPCNHVQELARCHLRELDIKIRELTALREQLRALLSHKPSARRGSEVCPIIES